MRLEVGTRLGPYEVLEPLGSGGMGEVFKGADTRIGRTVAIKVLAEKMVDREDAKTRFDREAKAIGAVNNRHICTLYDIGETPDFAYIVMEFVEGQTLAARLARGALSVQDAISVAFDVATAVADAHSAGVIHRDLKPSNIMLTPRSGAKLLDFGLAKLHHVAAPIGANLTTQSDDISHGGAVMGTLRYMAPEVLDGKEADARSDVFSLGAVFYEMLAGEAPFRGANNAQIILAIGKGKFRPLLELRPDVPPTIESLIGTCLATNPD